MPEPTPHIPYTANDYATASDLDLVAGVVNCGLVMPISQVEGYPSNHWVEVQDILVSAIMESTSYKFNVSLVSDAEDVGLIHKRIVQNIYDSSIVVCDVSSKNPNVMFELGLRLAFDKPTVIVKDTKTTYSFDTQVIEHLEYPADLRFGQMTEFKSKLRGKVEATYRSSIERPNESSFLKAFGTFAVQKLGETSVSGQEATQETLNLLSEISGDLRQLRTSANRSSVRGHERDWSSVATMITILRSALGTGEDRTDLTFHKVESVLLSYNHRARNYALYEEFSSDAHIAFELFKNGV